MSCDYHALANPGVAGLQPYQPGKPIEELQRELGLERIVKLASNENPLGPSPRALEACQSAAVDLVRYPDSSGYELKRALAERLGVDTEQITLGNGSNDVLDLLARAFLHPGRSAVYSQHAFIVYPIAIQACGAHAIVTQARDWGHDLEAMAAAIEEDTAMVFIANPNNPTGTSVSKQQLQAFLQKVPASVIVVLDEAYFEYAEGDEFPDGVSLLEDYPNLVVTRTFSKAYGLAALRVGYAVASAAVTDLLNRARAPFNVNSLALAAASAVLSDDEYLRRGRAVNSEGMEQLAAGFRQLGLPFIPSTGNFLALQLPTEPLQIYQQLLQQGVIVRPVGVYQMPEHLRVSVGLAEENALLLGALERVLAEA